LTRLRKRPFLSSKKRRIPDFRVSGKEEIGFSGFLVFCFSGKEEIRVNTWDFWPHGNKKTSATSGHMATENVSLLKMDSGQFIIRILLKKI
jgi:hypothetical protein